MAEANLTTQQLAELHVHLEGTIRHATAVALSAQNRLPAPPAYQYSDLSGFLTVYGQVSRCMVTSQDFERVIFEHGQVMASQHITYAEISFNPSLHPAGGWIDGLVRGRNSLAREFGIEIAWLVELVRGGSTADNERAIALYERVGFKREGLLRDAVLLDGRYMDMILMALINRPPDHPGGPASQ